MDVTVTTDSVASVPRFEKLHRWQERMISQQTGKFVSHRWWEARPEQVSNPSYTTLLSTAAPDLILMALLCCCLFLQDCFTFVSLSSVATTSLLHKAGPGKLKPVKGISCIHALTVGSERSFSWALLRQMGRDEEEKEGGKWQPWNQAGAFQSGDGGWGCQWPLLLPFEWVQIRTSHPGFWGRAVESWCTAETLQWGSGLPHHPTVIIQWPGTARPSAFTASWQGKPQPWQDPRRPLITVPMFIHPICPRLFPSNLCWFS